MFTIKRDLSKRKADESLSDETTDAHLKIVQGSIRIKGVQFNLYFFCDKIKYLKGTKS